MLVEIISSTSVTSWLFLFLAIAITLYLSNQKKKNLPPSPGLALPIIGHLYMLEKNPRKQFDRWAKQLGDVFSLQMGSQTVIVLNGYEVLKETLVKQADHFSDRPTHTFGIRYIPQTRFGIISTSGSLWKEQRTTALSILRNFGMGKNILAEKIDEEVSAYTDKLATFQGKSSDVRYLTNMSVSNVICSIIFGQRFEFDDPRFLHMMKLFDHVFKLGSGVSILNFFPFLQHIPFDPFGAKIFKTATFELRQFVRLIVKENFSRYNPDNIDNFIVAYINEMEKKQNANVSTFLDEVNLLRTIDNLFAAGTETTSTTIMWCMLYMLHYPKVQANVFKEIDENVGRDRRPNMMDKSKLTYLNAVIMETQRISSIAPLSLQHVCNIDSVVNGYTIPKDTTVIPNLDYVLRDEKVWGDPRNFRPERFIDDQGNLTKQEEFVPFSLGRRVCLGEGLAKMELFLYLSALLQRFQLVPADPQNIPPLKDTFGITAAPEPFNIRCVARNG